MTRQTCNVDRDTATCTVKRLIDSYTRPQGRKRKKKLFAHTLQLQSLIINEILQGMRWNMIVIKWGREVPGCSCWNHLRIAWLRCWGILCVWMYVFTSSCFAIPHPPYYCPFCFEFVYLYFCPDACQLSDLLDAVKHLLDPMSVIWLWYFSSVTTNTYNHILNANSGKTDRQMDRNIER